MIDEKTTKDIAGADSASGASIGYMPCSRCKRHCLPSVGSRDARLLRRANKGLCADCAVTAWLKNMEPLCSIIAEKGPDILLDPRAQEQFGRILKSGSSDMQVQEINWERIVEQWSI